MCPQCCVYCHAISTLNHVRVLLYGKRSGMAGFKILFSHADVSHTDTSTPDQLKIRNVVNIYYYGAGLKNSV